MADDSGIKKKLKFLAPSNSELKKIKSLVGSGRLLHTQDIASIEKKFVQPARLDGHAYKPGERSIGLVQKSRNESELSKIKNLIKKEETDLSKLKGMILSHRKGGREITRKEVSLRQIEKMERTKLADVQKEASVVDQKLSSSLEPAEANAQTAIAAPQVNAAQPAGQRLQVAEKTNLNPPAIPIPKENGKQAVQPAKKEGMAAQPEKKQDIVMPKEEAVDNRPLGEIIAEEEAKEKEKLAKEMEKEAAEDAKKAAGDKKEEKPAGKWAGFLSHLKPHPKEQQAQAGAPAAQQAGNPQAQQGAQPQQGVPQAQAAAQMQTAQAQPAAQMQGGGPTQIVLQVPSISSTPGKVTVQEEVDLRKLTMDVEKLGAEFSALKETKTQSDERLQRIAEDVGELRSLFFQREEAFRDTQSTAEKLKSAVEELEPDKFLKALHKGESELMLAQSKIEKLERISEEAGKQAKDMRAVLENVKGIDNLRELLREINTKSSKVEEMHNAIERSTNKVEKLYVEVDRKLGEFNTVKAKLITLDELTKELVKIVDEAKIKLDDTPNKSEFTTLERGMQEELKKATDSLEGVKQQLVSQLSDIQSKSGELTANMENFKQESRMQTTAVQMQFDKELAELRQQALMIIDAVKEEVQRNTINIDELKRMESYVELDRKIREHSLPSINQPYKAESRVPAGAKPQPVEEPKPPPRSVSPSEIRDSLEELKKRRGELTRLMDFLEDEYHRGIISERSYRESKENTKNRLAEITRMIEIKSKALAELPQSAGADDGRDLYFSSQRVKREVDREREGTPVSQLLDVQERFDKINEMLAMVGGARKAEPADGSGGRKELHPRGGKKASVNAQDTEKILSRVKAIRSSLDDKLGAAREHEHNIRQLHKEKERLKRYHPHIQAKK